MRTAIVLALLATACSSGAPSLRCVGSATLPNATCAPDDGAGIYRDGAGQWWAASCDEGYLECDASGTPTRYRFAQAMCANASPMGEPPNVVASCANGSAPRCRPVACASTGDAGAIDSGP